MKRFLKSTFVKFILLTMIFFVVTSPFVVLFGPFDNTKRAVVGAIMRSRHPQYITWLFNQNELNSILGVVNNTEQQKLFDFNIRKDSSLKIQKIESNRFVGYLLEIPDPSRIQVATAPDIQERGDTTSNIAKANDAVAAINGGGFYDRFLAAEPHPTIALCYAFQLLPRLETEAHDIPVDAVLSAPV